MEPGTHVARTVPERTSTRGTAFFPRGSELCGATFIVFQGMVKGEGLQALVQILYQILDKAINVV